MARNTAEVRAKLRETLTEIAEREMAKGGIGALKARALAAEAGCAVGAIYNVFDDMTGLVLAVNLRTFGRLGEAVRKDVANKADATPTDRLVTMGTSYLAFAAENPRLWRALFDVEMRADEDVPAWYLQELGNLFGIIAGPLAELYPNRPPEEIDLLVRTLFSSVHGIVLLGLEKRISGVPQERVEAMISTLLRNATSQAPNF